MTASAQRVFVLSPASTGGARAKLLFNDRAQFAMAQQVRKSDGAALGDVFAFLSGLYFRGKITYARRFARPATAIHIITSDRGLVSPDTRVTLDDLSAMARVPIDVDDPVYREPLLRDARRIDHESGGTADVVLLGSIATAKYVDVLGEVFGERLLFPIDFVGRGDMSRGGLLLRQVHGQRELEYQPVLGAIRSGKRPARLAVVDRPPPRSSG